MILPAIICTLLDVRNPARKPLDLIPTPHGVSIAHKAVGFSPGSVLTAFLLFTFFRVAPARGTEILPPPHVKRPDPAGGSKGKTAKTDSA